MGNKVVNDVSNSTIRNPNSALPEGWWWVRLGEVCQFEYGTGLPEHDRQKGNVPVYGSNGIVGYHSVSITEGPAIVIGRKGSIGQAHYSSVACWPIDTTYYVDASKTSCDLQWLFFLIKWMRLDAFNRATGVPGLNRNDAYSQVISLPPLLEQKRVAAKVQELMKDIEYACTACEVQLEAAKTLPSSYLRQVFESEEAKKWERKRLGEVCEFSNGKFIRREEIKAQGIYPVYGANGLIGFADRILLDKSVIIVGRVGSCGEINKSSGPAWITDNTIVLAPLKDLDFDFLYLALKTLKFEELRAASVQPLITQSDLKAALISVPCLSEQKRIADELNDKIASVEKLKADIEKQLETIKALSQAIFRKAFRGEL